jgi:glycerophosphoryl diester phosphodiesterase
MPRPWVLFLCLFPGACHGSALDSSAPSSQAGAMPLVIAHRGASAYLPEHTLEAYRLAIAQGADFIEPDLVPTRDGVLIARHENELSDSTDVADRPGFASRRARKRIDGEEVEGWFAEDFDWAEIQTLRARERLPALRPGSAVHDGRYRIPSFAQVIALARDESPPGRRVGVYPETKHPTWFEREGHGLDGERIGIDTSALLLDVLIAEGFTDPRRVCIQSFEVHNLLRLARELMPARGLKLPLIQLMGDLDPAGEGSFARPWDLAGAVEDDAVLAARYPGLAQAMGRSPAGMRYADLASPAGLRWLAGHVQGVGPWKDSLLPRRSLVLAAGSTHGHQLLGGVHPLLAEARSLGLDVHPYTLRAEPAFLSLDETGKPMTMEDELRRLLDAGATGFFTDHPDRGASVRDGR